MQNVNPNFRDYPNRRYELRKFIKVVNYAFAIIGHKELNKEDVEYIESIYSTREFVKMRKNIERNFNFLVQTNAKHQP